MIQTYQIRVRDLTGAVMAIFAGTGRDGGAGGLTSFNYLRYLNSVGQFALYVSGNDERLPYLQTINAQVEVWRRDPVAGPGWLAGLPSWRTDSRTLVTGWYKDFEGFVRAWNKGFTADGQRLFMCQGRQYNDLLAGETVNYPKDSAQANKTGLPGAVAAEYANQNIGTGAGFDALGNSRVRTGVTETVESDTATNWSGDRANLNLLDVLQELGDFGPGDFMVNGTGAATFEFRWRGTRWGLDRTPGNAAGNPPVVFSASNRNATQIRYGYNALDVVNAVYVAGQGQGVLRNYRTRASADAAAFNWSRRAVFRDARDTNDNTTLDARGDAVLEDNRARYSASFEALQTTATRYGRDWDLGDLVRFIDDDGTATDLNIRGVQVSVDAEGVETITPQMETEA